MREVSEFLDVRRVGSAVVRHPLVPGLFLVSDVARVVVEKGLGGCLRRCASNRAATVRERFSHVKPDRFLTGAALKKDFLNTL